jgi:hypothetical protein
LDPNNPRFASTGADVVPDKMIENPQIQEAIQQRLVSGFDVDRLRMNMEVNGYLPIDRIIVRSFAKDKYVVLEGNRRLCAAKMISDVASDGSDVSREVKESLKELPCLLYTGSNPRAAWLFQGIRHITGLVEWSSFNKAKLLVEQMEEDQLSLRDVGKRFGLTQFGAGQWMRGYYAYKQAREESDYVNEVGDESYPYFQELFSRSSAQVRDWMEWDEAIMKFSNALNFNEFIGWLYPRAEPEQGQAQTSAKGDWNRRVIRVRDDVRNIAYLVADAPEFFKQFRRDLDLERAYSEARAKKYEDKLRLESDPVAEVFAAIHGCAKALDNIPHKILKDRETKEKLDIALTTLQEAIDNLK